MQMIKIKKIDIFYIVILAITTIAGFCTLNKFWFPYDDGYTLNAATLIANGACPYKDFIVPYPPIQYYILAGLFKIFGINHLVARTYILFANIVVVTIAYFLSLKLSLNKKISFFAALTCMLSLMPRLGSNLSLTWSGILFSYLSALFFYYFLEKKSVFLLFSAGVFAGIALFSKQDIGVYLIAAQIATILLLAATSYLSKTKTSGSLTTQALTYCAGCSLLPGIFVIYFLAQNAFSDFVKSVLLPITALRNHSHIELSPFCFDPRQIFYGSLRFVSINQFYIPLIIYSAVLILLVLRFAQAKKRPVETRDIFAFFMLLFGIFFYNFVLYRSDDMHLLFSISPAIILFSYLWSRVFAIEKRIHRPVIIALVAFVGFLLILLDIKNSDKFLKNSIIKPLTKKIIRFETKRGTIYIPYQQEPQVRQLLSFLQTKFRDNDLIFIWYQGASYPEQGTDLILYFFLGKLPPIRQYVVLPGYSNLTKTQEDMIAQLKAKAVRYIILTNTQEGTKEDMLKRKGPLDNYIETGYNLINKIGPYNIYELK